MLELAPGFAWIGSTPALVALAIATLVEVGAYYVPLVDNLLDTVASPLAVVAGTVLAAAVIADLDPLLKWSLAIIAGGGTAALVQANTVAARLASSATTGGVGNPVVSTAELGGAAGVATLSVLAPAVVVVVLVATVVLWTLRPRPKRTAPPARIPAAPCAPSPPLDAE
jgi:hypothetical protein